MVNRAANIDFNYLETLTLIRHSEKVLIMRIFLSIFILILIFSLQSLSRADSIRDFEIDGMSVGKSLLEYYSKKEIDNQLFKMSSFYKSDKFKRIYFNPDSNSEYIQYNFHYRNDISYEIVEVKGGLLFENKLDECLEKRREISNKVENSINFIDKYKDSFSHRADKTGKSKIHRITFVLNDGEINISCFEWSKDIKNNRPWRDTLQVSIGSNLFFDWLKYEAYK